MQGQMPGAPHWPTDQAQESVRVVQTDARSLGTGWVDGR